jgi:hypothetical protein
MATLTAASTVLTGLVVSGVEPGAAGDVFTNTGKEVVVINNASVGSINVTLDHKDAGSGAVVVDPVVAVGAGVIKVIGPFPKGRYDDSNGQVKVSCSAQTDITIQVLKVTPA